MKPRARRLELITAILGVLYRRKLGALETIDFHRRVIWIRHVKSDCRVGFRYRYETRQRILNFAGNKVAVNRMPNKAPGQHLPKP
jgi:hypothetical protein